VEANNKHEIAYLELGFCGTIFLAFVALPAQPTGKPIGHTSSHNISTGKIG